MPLKVVTNTDKLTINCRIGNLHSMTQPRRLRYALLADHETRWGRGPPVGTAVRIEPCDDLIESTAHTFRRNRDPHPDRKTVARHPEQLVVRLS
jgi:hypothetical protein